MALALVLLVGAGLLMRSFMRLLDVDPGFDPSRTLTMRLTLPAARYGAEGQRAQFFCRFFQQVDALPGVEPAGAISFLPLTGLGAATSMEIVGQPIPPKGQEPVADVRVITHDYLEAMGVPLLKGRLFNEQDAADAKGRVVINETMAERYWPGEDPIGKRVRIAWDSARRRSHRRRRRHVKHTGLDAESPRDDVLAIRAQSVRDDDRSRCERPAMPAGVVNVNRRDRAPAGSRAGRRQRSDDGRSGLELGRASAG